MFRHVSVGKLETVRCNESLIEGDFILINLQTLRRFILLKRSKPSQG